MDQLQPCSLSVLKYIRLRVVNLLSTLIVISGSTPTLDSHSLHILCSGVVFNAFLHLIE